jgi:hypothetical protein
MVVDYVTLAHDLEMSKRVEEIVKNLLHMASEFITYLHRPRILFNDRRLQINIRWALYQLGRKKLHVAGRIAEYADETARLRILHLCL